MIGKQTTIIHYPQMFEMILSSITNVFGIETTNRKISGGHSPGLFDLSVGD
jgi:hypothetical protein